MKHFNKLSDWLDIEKDDNNKDIFVYSGQQYRVYDFTKIHYNPWFGDDSEFPQFITGIERNPGSDPLFIEVNDVSNQVRVYEEVK